MSSSSGYSDSESYTLSSSMSDVVPRRKPAPKKPNKKQHSGSGRRDAEPGVPGLTYGFSSMQGWRPEMEDAHCALPDSGSHHYSYFGVFDGHGGHEVADLCAVQIPDRINAPLDKISLPAVSDVVSAIKTAYISIDEELITKAKKRNTARYPGSTAVIAVLTPSHLVVGSAGDSRIVVSQNGKCVPMTIDHSVKLPHEKARIEMTDFHVDSSDSMVAGRMPHDHSDGSEAHEALNMSRSIGDVGFKLDRRLHRTAQAVVADPEISHIARDGSIEFILLACDGIFEAMTNEVAVDYVNRQLRSGNTPEQAARRLLTECLARGSMDNMTAMIVVFDTLDQRPRLCWCC